MDDAGIDVGGLPVHGGGGAFQREFGDVLAVLGAPHIGRAVPARDALVVDALDDQARLDRRLGVVGFIAEREGLGDDRAAREDNDGVGAIGLGVAVDRLGTFRQIRDAVFDRVVGEQLGVQRVRQIGRAQV